MKRLFSALSGERITARALRGSGLTLIGFGGSNILRLVSNLILTRLLFPEAFGLMALVQVFTTGLQMFSDIGINTSIIQSKRGEDPDFLNTAWTLKIIRGFILWLFACALAPLAAWIYDEPMLLLLLPVVGFNSVIRGFATTKMTVLHRNLKLGRQTFLSLGTQAIGIVIMTVLAWWLESVWALVIGGLATSAFNVVLMHYIMPGMSNRFRFEKEAFWEIIGFGKFILLSTLATFLINQGDRAILGGYISMAELGIYNIGFFMGTVPWILNKAINNKVLFPLYRLRPPNQSTVNRDKIFRARRIFTLATLSASAFMAFFGNEVITLLYDDRYLLAGPMVILFSLVIVPSIVIDGYNGVLLASGDSKRFFVLQASTAVLQVACLLIGIQTLGLLGAICAIGMAALITYPLRIRYTRLYNAWDARGDAVLMTLGLGLNGFACWWHRDLLMALSL
ncbi:oligosaccharide flippase family protein [Roseobacter sp. S98]|uniref:oligosaccharide flippase family protein n=1 Tax=Roseobacter algicola (ex Choi et al. 2025) (nom. illeg.) TaxID=3092138 RepID=UPI0035C68E26